MDKRGNNGTARQAFNITPWVSRFASLIPANATVLDLACGGGRHTRFFLERGNSVISVDKDTSGLTDCQDNPACKVITVDLEAPEGARTDFIGKLPFDLPALHCIVVVNYLYRPLLSALAQALAPGGILIYQTFMEGNAEFGRPKNPDFLLKAGELANAFCADFDQIEFFEGFVSIPKKAMIQCYCGRKR